MSKEVGNIYNAEDFKQVPKTGDLSKKTKNWWINCLLICIFVLHNKARYREQLVIFTINGI